MVRSFTRNVACFLAAVVLLALLVCAAEVGLRAQRLRERLSGKPVTSVTLSSLIRQPSRTSYYEPQALLFLTAISESGQPVEIRTSEWGTRGDSPAVPKPRKTYRIVCLGGSDTFGGAFNESDTFCSLLQTYLQTQTDVQVEVINAGTPECGPLAQQLRLRNRLLPLQPDLIVMNLQGEELAFDAEVRSSLRLDAEGHSAFSCHPKFTTHSNQLMDGLREEYAVADRVLKKAPGMVAGGQLRSFSRDSAEDLTLLTQPIREAGGLARSMYAGFAVALVPDIWQIQPDGDHQAPGNLLRGALAPLSRDGELTVLDALPAFQRDQSPRTLFTSEGRLSREGHQLYAGILARSIVQRFPGIWTGRTESTEFVPNEPDNSAPDWGQTVNQSAPFPR